MTRLEDIRTGASVRGLYPGQVVEVVSADWIGDQAVNVVFRNNDGVVSESTLYRDDEHRLEIDVAGRQ